MALVLTMFVKGAVVPGVIKQARSLSDNQDAITVSVGGNDVGFVDILDRCLYKFYPHPLTSCSDQVAEASRLIDELGPKLDELYDVVAEKLSAEGTAYITGYAKFFDESTTDCDKVSFSFFLKHTVRRVSHPRSQKGFVRSGGQTQRRTRQSGRPREAEAWQQV